jgi:plastocyanin
MRPVDVRVRGGLRSRGARLYPPRSCSPGARSPPTGSRSPWRASRWPSGSASRCSSALGRPSPTSSPRSRTPATSPASITIHQGESITWVNQGSLPHSITADDGSFDSGPIAPGARAGNTFTELGTFNYHSTGEGTFRGSVTVLSIDTTAPPPTPSASSVLPLFPSTQPGPPATGGAGTVDTMAIAAMAIAVCAVLASLALTGRIRCWGRSRPASATNKRRGASPRRPR